MYLRAPAASTRNRSVELILAADLCRIRHNRVDQARMYQPPETFRISPVM
jgi:hypothetical protein